MRMLQYVAIPLGLMLVISAGLGSYYPLASAAGKQATVVEIDEVPGKVRPGEGVTIAGTITTADGEPLPPQTPLIVYLLTSDPRLVEAASGVTGLEGTFEIVWDVELVFTYRASHDTVKSIDTQVMSLFVQFEGDDTFAPSKSSKTTVTIEVNSLKTFVNPDKKEYNEGDSATIFLGFVDADEIFVDPESINANFNGTPIGDLLERKKSGSYTYVTPPLQ
ncbi:MAG: hypothetical protein ACE5JV_03935, partial [Nitrososphaerales archaeon]